MIIYRTGTRTGADKWYKGIANLLGAQLCTGDIPHGYTGVIICPIVLAGRVRHRNPTATIIGALHRDIKPDTRYCDKVIFCAEHLQAKYSVNIPNMVYRPWLYDLQPRESRERKGSVIGMVNLSTSKGGSEAARLARDGWSVLARHNRDIGVPGVTVQPYGDDMQSFYDAIDVLYLPYRSEGYSTVALEGLSQGLPIVGSLIPGLLEVCDYALTANSDFEYVFSEWRVFSIVSIDQYKEVSQLNNPYELRKFTSSVSLPIANPHHCPECSWQCTCSDQPCSCCSSN